MKSIISLFCCILVFTNIACADTPDKWEKIELSTKNIENLEALSYMYGYARYFYPNENINKWDWFKFLIYAVPKVVNVENQDDLRDSLRTLFSPIIPNMSWTEVNDEDNSKRISDFYVKKNFPGQAMKGLQSEIIHVNKWAEQYPRPDSLYCFPVGQTMKIYYPLAVSNLPRKNKSLVTLQNSFEKIELKTFSSGIMKALLSGHRDINFVKSASCRIANLILIDNAIRHFYPYYAEDGLEKKWILAFNTALAKISVCNTPRECLYIIKELCSNVDDFHLQVTSNFGIGKVSGYIEKYYPSISFDLTAKNEVYVCNNPDSCSNIRFGDEVINVNGMAIEDWLKLRFNQISCSNLASGRAALAKGELFSAYKKDSIISLTLEDSKKRQRKYNMVLNSTVENLYASNNFVEELENNIWYINLCNTEKQYKDLKPYLPYLRQASGIVVDVRTYPNPAYARSVLAHIIHDTIRCGIINVPVYYFPNQKSLDWVPAELWSIAPANSSYSKEYAKKYGYAEPEHIQLECPIIFLAGNKTVSFGETLVEMVKYYNLGTIIGEPTNGTNGDVTWIDLPFCPFFMTGYKFVNRDGSQHHSIGILPDITVCPRLSDIRNNKDVVLKEAVRYLKARTEKAVDTLNRFSSKLNRKTFVVLDNASVHRNENKKQSLLFNELSTNIQ